MQHSFKALQSKSLSIPRSPDLSDIDKPAYARLYGLSEEDAAEQIDRKVTKIHDKPLSIVTC